MEDSHPHPSLILIVATSDAIGPILFETLFTWLSEHKFLLISSYLSGYFSVPSASFSWWWLW